LGHLCGGGLCRTQEAAQPAGQHTTLLPAAVACNFSYRRGFAQVLHSLSIPCSLFPKPKSKASVWWPAETTCAQTMTRACRTLSVHMSALLPSPHDMQPCPQGAQAQATQGAFCCQGALWGWLQRPCQEPTVCGLEPHHPTCTPKGPACSTYSGQGVCCQPQAPCGSQGTYSAVKVLTSAQLCVASRWGVRPPCNLPNKKVRTGALPTG
jgi:hypothetical protein